MYKTTGFKRAFVVVLLAALIVAAGSVLYWRQVTRRLSADARASIAELSRESAAHFNRLISAQLQVLTALAVSLETPDALASQNKLISYLNRQNKRNSFDLTGFQYKNGLAVFSNGASVRDFLSSQDVAFAYEHSHFISALRKDPFDGKPVLVLAIPLRAEGKKLGVVFATQPAQFYAEALKTNLLGKNGFEFIVSSKGEIVLSSSEAPYANVFDVASKSRFDAGTSALRLRRDLEEGRDGLTGYEFEGCHRFASYYPLAYNGWHALSVLPTASVADKAQTLMWMSLALCLSIIGVLGLLLAFILRMQYKNSRALYRLGFVDPLTGKDNLNAFRFHFAEAAAALKEHGAECALAVVNVNRFKAVNDIYGFELGDQVLKQVASSLQEGLAEKELFCRCGADVFLLLLQCPRREALGKRVEALAERAGRFCRAGKECLPMSLTCGIYVLDEDVPFYIMMDRANLALASAKRSAGRSCAFYDESHLRQIVTEKRIESSMEQALENGDFKLYLQPKCRFKTGLIQSAEALVRWKHPSQGLIPPDWFIPVFEKNGFVLKLDMFMLKETLALLKRWKEESRRLIPVGVNFSRLHLADADFVQTLSEEADRFGVDHSLLEVELTESVVFGNEERMKQVIDQLHGRGFSVAMDDFGSGYSSLNVLKNLCFDCVKLDKEFLARGEGNPRMRQIISGAVKMIKSLGSRVVAEGVETREQAEFLHSIGCDLAQGYLFSRPLPVEDFERRLGDETPE